MGNNMGSRLMLNCALILSSWITRAVSANSIAAWYTTGLSAPQIIMYDETTRKIYYSLCNSNVTPIFPYDDSTAFDFRGKNLPLNITKLSGSGYQSDSGSVAAIQYENEDNQIIHSLWTCDSTGHFHSSDEQTYIASSIAKVPSIAPGTGIATVNLGGAANQGYRIYYKNAQRDPAIIRYTTQTNWDFHGNISQIGLSGISIAAAALGPQITVAETPNVTGTESIAVWTMDVSEVWTLKTFPDVLGGYYIRDDAMDSYAWLDPVTSRTDWSLHYNWAFNATNRPWELDAYNGSTVNLGLTYDSQASRSVFYIGTDQTVHQIQENSDGTWNKTSGQDKTVWPVADNTSASFGTAFESASDRIWLYYMVDGAMTQVQQLDHRSWGSAFALPRFNATPPASSPSAGSPDGSSSNQTVADTGAGGELSSGAKAGIGVGVGVGVPVLIAIIAVYMYFHLKRSRQNRDRETAAVQAAHADATAAPAAGGFYYHPRGSSAPTSTVHGSPAPGYTSGHWGEGYWADGQWVSTGPVAGAGMGKRESGADWRQSHQYYGDKTVSPQPTGQTLYELPQPQQTHEMPGDGQINKIQGAETRREGVQVPRAGPHEMHVPEGGNSQERSGAVDERPGLIPPSQK